MFHNLEKDAVQRTRQTGTKKRVDDEVISSLLLCDPFPVIRIFTLHKAQRRTPIHTAIKVCLLCDDFKVSARIVLQVIYSPKQDDVNLNSGVEKFDRQSRAIAAIVSSSAKYLCAFTRKVSSEMVGDCPKTS